MYVFIMCIHCIRVYTVLVCAYGVSLALSIGSIAGIRHNQVSSVWVDKQAASAHCDANVWYKFCQSMPKPLKERV